MCKIKKGGVSAHVRPGSVRRLLGKTHWGCWSSRARWSASPTNPWTWQFKPGDYRVNATIMVPVGAGSLKGVSLKSDPAAPARIIREAVWDVAHSPEPLLLRFAGTYAVDGFCRNAYMRPALLRFDDPVRVAWPGRAVLPSSRRLPN